MFDDDIGDDDLLVAMTTAPVTAAETNNQVGD